MQSRLLSSIDQLAIRARRLVMVHAAALTLCYGLGAATILAILDYIVHFQDHGIRWLQFLTLLMVMAAACLRFLRPAFQCRFGPVLTARHVEGRFPQLGQRLSSAVSFLLENEGQQISPFQQALVEQVESQLADLNMEACLRTRRTRRALVGCAVLLTVVVGCFSWQRSDTLFAAGRLVQPWGETSWPRRHRMRLEGAPHQVARGSHFEVRLVDDGGRLPRKVLFEVVYDGGSEKGRYETSTRSRSFDFRLEQVTRSFFLRASGGDDDTMAWQRVNVVEPPSLQDVRLLVHSPAYTARKTELTSGDLRLIAGSRLDVEVVADRPLERVELVFENGRGQFREFLQPGPRRTHFSLDPETTHPWVVNEPGTYWFELAGDVMARSRSWRLDAIPDRPPTAIIESPLEDEAFWTRAVVPIIAEIRDDIRIRDIHLQYRLRSAGEQQDQLILVEQGPALATPADSTSFEEDFSGDHRRILFAWDLGLQQDLEAGEVVDFELVVTDYKGNTAASNIRQLRLLDRQDMIGELVRRYMQISDTLGELAGSQRLLVEQTSRLRGNVLAEQVAKEVAGPLQQLLLQQQKLDEKLGGVLGRARQLEGAVVANHLDGVDVAGQVDEMENSLSRVIDEMMPPLKQHLSASWKLVDASTADSVLPEGGRQQVASLVEAAEQLQEKVVESLEKLAGVGTQGNRLRTLLAQLEQAREDQKQILERTRTRQLELLTGLAVDGGGSTPRALEPLVDRQQLLGEDIARLQRQLRIVMRDERSGESHRDVVRRAWELSRQAALSGQLLATVQSLRDQQLGKAGDQMVAISEILAAMIDILTDRYGGQLEEAVTWITSLLEKIETLENEQRMLVESLREAGKEREPQSIAMLRPLLADRQESVGEQLVALEAAVQRAGPAAVSDQLELARSASGRGSMACREGDFLQALGLAEEVVLAIHRAGSQLKQLGSTTRNRMALRKLDQLDPKLAEIYRQQEDILAGTGELDRSRKQRPGGNLLRSEQITLSDLARRQQHLSDELVKSAGQLVPVSPVRFVLEEAARGMGKVAGLLKTEQTGDECQKRQQQLLDRILQVQNALANVLASSPPDSRSPMASASSEEADALLQSPAELELVLLMQKEILEQTRMLERIRQRQEDLLPHQQQQERELIRRQAQLAALVSRIRNANRPGKAEGGRP
ncbi:MAG: hypothetical protein VB855_07060 [Pirellulaceae bacterium]